MKVIFVQNKPNPKYKWYNLEPKYIEEKYYLKIKDGEVVLGDRVE